MLAAQSHDDRSWAHATIYLNCSQQAPKTRNSLLDASEAQRPPECCLITAEDRLFQVLFKCVEDPHRWHSSPTQQHGLGVGRIRLTRQLIGALFAFRIDILHTRQPLIANDVEPGRFPKGSTLGADGFGIWGA